MNREELAFHRPPGLEARSPPEWRGIARDAVRLLVSDADGEHHARFADLEKFLHPGDLLVVNRSATLAASLPARAPFGDLRLHLSTRYSDRLWLAEPRWDAARPGPLPVHEGTRFALGPATAVAVAQFPGQPRLWFLRFDRKPRELMQKYGSPIRYGYSDGEFPLPEYQTIFGRTPGSAEMPSAGRPFTERVLTSLSARGVSIAEILLHASVSSLEVESIEFEREALLPEPFEVGARTVTAVERTHLAGGRVVAVGTTVVRALEAAAGSGELRPTRGFTRRRLMPGVPVRVVDGLLTGFHDPYASHLALLHALAGPSRVRAAYRTAVEEGYLWHEFGDSHLLLPPPRAAVGG
ncbi:MAG: S-adenosylmethionine:tRNA ribosyltransferase-isomerase [Thermoplasmata archaeon]|nr:S-adenosylmethionine:tRNA ribosyltransferase-isomerase [Thermoplasmata archaeon]